MNQTQNLETRVAIDLGTNTCLMLIAEWDQKNRKINRVLSDQSTIVRLGQGVDHSRMLQNEAIVRTLNCLKNYKKQIPSDARVFAVGTSQARDARNASEFFNQVVQETGISFEILSGEDEAKYTFLGALLPGMDPENTSVIDIGGGSTEIMTHGFAKSLDLGSVRFTERFFKSNPVSDSEFWNCQEAIDEAIQCFAGLNPTNLVGVAGTVTTLAGWHLGLEKFDSSQINGCVLTRGDIHRMTEELKWRTTEERRSLPSVEFLRADVLLAGAMILWRIMEFLNIKELQASTQGLRYGIFHRQV